MKAVSYLPEVLLDPKTAMSQEPNKSAFNLAFNTDLTTWEWLSKEENERFRKRFGIAMEGAKQASPPDAILDGRSISLVSPFGHSHRSNQALTGMA